MPCSLLLAPNKRQADIILYVVKARLFRSCENLSEHLWFIHVYFTYIFCSFDLYLVYISYHAYLVISQQLVLSGALG